MTIGVHLWNRNKNLKKKSCYDNTFEWVTFYIIIFSDLK